MRNIKRWSFRYEVLKFFASIVHRAAHKYFTVNGLENVPRNEPVILAPNHQNALLDPLAIIFSGDLQPAFLARADIFRNKVVAGILNRLKIAPVYRIRDGKDSLEKNKEVFENSINILKTNRFLCLFPEAAHIGMKSMIPHKKAIPRIVFIAAEMTNFEMDIKIVPVGINYTHYYQFRRSLTINYGKPISSKDYYELYKNEGELKASIALRDAIFEAMKELVVHVPDKPGYDLYDQAFAMMRPEAYEKAGVRKSLKNFVKAEQLLTEKIYFRLENYTEDKEALIAKAKLYKKLKEKLGFSEDELEKGSINSGELLLNTLLITLLIPLGTYGAIANGWLFYLTRYPYRSRIKDPQFWSTFSFVFSLVFYPLWLIVQFFILRALLPGWAYALGITLFSIPSGIIGWETGQMIKRNFRRIKYKRLLKSKNKHFRKMLSLRKELKTYYQKTIEE